jgi:hypothetical protein
MCKTQSGFLESGAQICIASLVRAKSKRSVSAGRAQLAGGVLSTWRPYARTFSPFRRPREIAAWKRKSRPSRGRPSPDFKRHGESITFWHGWSTARAFAAQRATSSRARYRPRLATGIRRHRPTVHLRRQAGRGRFAALGMVPRNALRC